VDLELFERGAVVRGGLGFREQLVGVLLEEVVRAEAVAGGLVLDEEVRELFDVAGGFEDDFRGEALAGTGDKSGVEMMDARPIR